MTKGYSQKRDTILILKKGAAFTYYMEGRKINLPIMEWFMQDYPEAKREITGAIMTDQLSVASYSVGSLFAVTGLLVYEPNKRLGKDLLTIGGITLGSGIVFQLVSGKYKNRAVQRYNKEVKKNYIGGPRGAGVSLRVDFSGDQTRIVIGF